MITGDKPSGGADPVSHGAANRMVEVEGGEADPPRGGGRVEENKAWDMSPYSPRNGLVLSRKT